MKLGLATVSIALVSVPAFSQSVATGVSNPEPVVISAQADETAPVRTPGAKPSAAIPAEMPKPTTVRDAKAGGEVYGPYVPYRGAVKVDGVEEASVRAGDPDAQIVTSVEERPGEVREGTLLRAHIKQSLSTVTTVRGTRFTAELAEPVEKQGRVVLPVGAVIEGRVTEVHGGRRISGAAMMHLEAKSVTLPDGTHYLIHAQLVDTDQTGHTSVDHEGTLLRRGHPKATLAAVGLAAGGAAAAGAVIGGGVGAVVGAGVGAGAGTVLWLKQDRQAVLPENSLLVFSLTDPMPVMPMGGHSMSKVEPAPRVEMRDSAGAIVE